MFDVLNKFQNAALAFDPMMLVVPGVLCVLLGIVIWLAGTRFISIIAVVIGFIGGAMGAFYLVTDHQISAAILGAVIGALAAIFIHRFVVISAGIFIFTIVGLIIIVSGQFSDKVNGGNYRDAGGVPMKLAPVQTAEQIKSHLATVADKLLSLSKYLPLRTWLAFVAAMAALLVLGMFISSRLFTAFSCSSIGTAIIFAGMIGLMLYKGSAPLTYMYERISFFFAVFVGMVVVGTVSQMIVCRPLKLKILRDSEQEKEKNKEIKERQSRRI
ncbi:MAG: hypothetical protein Q7T18_12360 [Sedimentisphaerales bacterium]|nr:hypothetical protein [Sedimentisphaerales bacterium]